MSNKFKSVVEQLRSNAATFADAQASEPHLDVHPQLQLAVVTCMDSRIDLFGILGLNMGEAHILRNAGGVVSDDTIRSLVISQHVLDTRSIVLIHHTDCSLQKISDDSFKDQIEAELGIRPSWAIDAFRDPFLDVAQSAERIKHSPFLSPDTEVYGFVYDVDTHQLLSVEL